MAEPEEGVLDQQAEGLATAMDLLTILRAMRESNTVEVALSVPARYVAALALDVLGSLLDLGGVPPAEMRDFLATAGSLPEATRRAGEEIIERLEARQTLTRALASGCSAEEASKMVAGLGFDTVADLHLFLALICSMLDGVLAIAEVDLSELEVMLAHSDFSDPRASD